MDDVLSEVAALGFAVDDVRVRQWLPESPVGVALISAQRSRAERASPRRAQRLPHLLRVNPLFDRDWYRRQNPDVRASGMNPLLHYLKHGRAEGRKPTAPRDRS